MSLWSLLRRSLASRRAPAPARIEELTDIWSPQLENSRGLSVYLPPDYDGTKRFPVIYLQDGQNLFDPATSYAGDWGLASRLDTMAAAGGGVQAIVVGIWNAGDDRVAEYSLVPDAQAGGGRGDAYLRFVTNTVKPLIDRRFRTDAGRATTGIGGSSMGGLISLYGLLQAPLTFGFGVVMSPSVWFADRDVVHQLERSPLSDVRLYVDIGAREGARALGDAGLLRDALVKKGFREGVDFRYVEDPDGEHREAAWGRRFPSALSFTLASRSDA